VGRAGYQRIGNCSSRLNGFHAATPQCLNTVAILLPLMKRIRKNQDAFKAKVFEALSDPARLRIISFLRNSGKCVNDITEKTGMLQPSVSRHLKILKERGIVKESRLGSRRIYRITDPRIFKIVDSLDSRLEESLKRQVYESIM